MLIWVVTLVGSLFSELANILNGSILDAFNGTILRSFLQQTVIGRIYIAQLLIALIAIVTVHRARKVGSIYCVLALTILATILPVFQSHSSGLSNHSLAQGSLVFHVIFITLWVGGVIGLLVISPASREISIERFSSFALWAAIIVSLSGLINAYARLNFIDAWKSSYASFVLAKGALTILLIAFGAKHRRFILNKKPDAIYSLLGVEVFVMVLTVAVGGWLSTLQPPVHPGVVSQPAPPNFSRLFWSYNPDLLFLGILILATSLYIRGVVILSRRGDKWPIGRTVAFICGVGFADYATSGGVGIYASYSFSYHIIAHMIIGMIAPIGFVLSAPLTLALRTLPIGRTPEERGIRGTVISAIHSKVMFFYSHPIVVWQSLMALSFALHDTTVWCHDA